MFFEKLGGRGETLMRGLGALIGGAGEGYASWKLNDDMSLRPRVTTAILAGLGGTAAGYHAEKAFNPLNIWGKANALQFVGGEMLGQKLDTATKDNAAVAQNIATAKAQETLSNTQAAASSAQTAAAHSGTQLQDSIRGALPYALGGAGLLGLGGLAAYLAKPNKGTFAPGAGGVGPAADPPGRMILTLPTKRPGDPATVLDLPMSGLKIPQRTLRHIGRDTKRVLRLESADRDRLLAPGHEDKQANLSPMASSIINRASVGAGIGGLFGLINPRTNQDGTKKNRGMEALRDGLIGAGASAAVAAATSGLAAPHRPGLTLPSEVVPDNAGPTVLPFPGTQPASTPSTPGWNTFIPGPTPSTANTESHPNKFLVGGVSALGGLGLGLLARRLKLPARP